MDDTQLFILSIGALGFGMYLLFKGGDWTIDSAVYIARKFGISPMVIGFTIVAFGTSFPELLVSVNANLAGSPGIAIGNVIGSNIANILFVVGATAIVATMVAVRKELLRDVIVMMLATVFMMYFMTTGAIGSFAGGIMIVFLLSYIIYQYIMTSKGKIKPDEVEMPEFKNMGMACLFLLLGLGSIAFGAEFLVRGAKTAATIIGVPEAVIGLSIIAIGTSLPELSTCIIAAMKKQTDIILGNILGSNVFNILMIMGVTSMVKPIEQSAINPQVVSLDMWVMFGVSALFSLILLAYGKINKPIGIVFLAGYIFYIGLIYALYLQDDLNILSS
ncbi:MAG: calcium/sodium antiporter [Pseudomonadota bacterium]